MTLTAYADAAQATLTRPNAVVVGATDFPSQGMLDNFSRSNGGIGSQWSGQTSEYRIASNRLDMQSGGDIYWNATAFGADQEAYVTLTTVDQNASELDLLLKAQSSSNWNAGVLEVWYDPVGHHVQVVTYVSSQGWVQRGADIPVTFANGDQLGARAKANGTVEVYRNGVLLATRDVTGWPYYANGGYIGLWCINAGSAYLDNFGGGTVQIPLAAAFSASPVSGNVPLTVTFTNQSTPTSIITSYLWTFGDGVTATITNPVHSYTSAGYYTVTLKAMAGAAQHTITKTNYITATSSGSAPRVLTTTIRYTYDPLQRLTGATATGATTYTFAYAYDAVGNRTAQTRTVTNTLVTNYSYDAANRLTAVNGVTYSWDNNGNLKNDGSKVYTYTQANRLITMTASGLSWSATYNSDGARLKQTVNGGVTTYTQDLAAPLPVVLQARTGDTTTLYLFDTHTRPLAEYDTAWEYLLPDGLGSVRQLADGNGNVTLSESYEPYGSVLSSQGSAASVFGFTGEQTDSTGLVFLRARYMQPKTGRFTQRDVWEGDRHSPQSLHLYIYVQNKPIDLTDPSGLYPTIGSVISFWEWVYSKDGWHACDIFFKDDGQELPTDNVIDLFGDYLCERGPDRRVFTAHDTLTWDLASSKLTDKVRRKFYNGELDQSQEVDFDIAEFFDALDDVFQPFPGSPIPIAHYLGGWSSVKIVPEDGKSTRRLRWTVENQTDRASGTHLPMRHETAGYTEYLEDLVHKDSMLALMPAGYEWALPVIAVLEPKTRAQTSDDVTPKEGGGAYEEIFTWTEDYFCGRGSFIAWPYYLDYLNIGE